MELASNIISDFVKNTNDSKDEKRETTMYGTIVQEDTKFYVKIDGSEELTPFIPTTSMKVSDRVIVTIKDRKVYVKSNMTSPGGQESSDIENIKNRLDEIDDIITTIRTEIQNISTTLNNLSNIYLTKQEATDIYATKTENVGIFTNDVGYLTSEPKE